MAIIGVRTGLIQGCKHSLKCTLLNHISNGTESGESNKITAGVATATMGKALNAAGNPTAAREIKMATMTRQKPVVRIR